MNFSRRDFLKTSGLLAAFSALAACSPLKKNAHGASSSVGIQGGPLQLIGDDLIVHTLKRMTYGATPELIDKARRMGLEAFIEEQLNPASIPDPEVDSLLQRFTTLTMTPAERLRLDPRGLPVQELIAATILRQWHSQRQIYEMLVEFWSNHFSIFIGKNLCRALKTDDDQKAIRPNALGKFGDLLNASAHSPAMLIFLDNAESRAEAPNENYARELMELHTVGVDGGYTQDDVEQAARVLTGWSITGPNSFPAEPGQFIFRPGIHDKSEKHVMGLTLAPGGEDEGNQLLDMLAHHPSTAKFISTKLARRFIGDSPDAALVDSLANAFTDSGGDTKAMIRAIVASEAFKNSAGGKMKRPLEFFVSALRLTGATFNQRSKQLQDHLRLLGQVPFTWQAPNGFPDVAGFWATTSGLLERWNFGMSLASGQIAGTRLDLKSLIQGAQSAQDVVDALSLRLLGGVMPDDARSILLDFASSGDLGANIPSILGLILGSPHFQVR